jgi:hypothetical protein
MYMVGHDDITSDRPAVAPMCVPPFVNYNRRNVSGSEECTAFESAGGDEIDRPIDPNAFEPAQNADAFAHL